jgi:hypothetical protein
MLIFRTTENENIIFGIQSVFECSHRCELGHKLLPEHTLLPEHALLPTHALLHEQQCRFYLYLIFKSLSILLYCLVNMNV